MKKVVYLAIGSKQKMDDAYSGWKAAMNRFSIMFEERVIFKTVFTPTELFLFFFI